MLMNLIVPACVLIAGVVDDLRSRKIHNSLILILGGLVLAFVFMTYIYENKVLGSVSITRLLVPALLWGVLPAVGKGLLALGLTIPLVLLKIIGGGDMKLYAVLALALSPRMLFMSLLAAVVWAGILGLVKAILDKKIRLILLNLWLLVQFKKPEPHQLNTFPFSVSLLVGWLSATWY